MWNEVLAQFSLRIALGLAMALMLLPAGQVRSAFFRVHAYVIMGLCVVATLALWQQGPSELRWFALATAVGAYAGSIPWLYEARGAGRGILGAVFVWACICATMLQRRDAVSDTAQVLIVCADVQTSGAVLGFMLGSMLLGHWYLNSPEMQLDPLRRLLRYTAGAIALRAAVCGIGLGLLLAQGEVTGSTGLFLALRWAAGIVGAAIATWMAWKTLAIPNTQSATGILYAGVVVVFLGELTSLLVGRGHAYPL